MGYISQEDITLAQKVQATYGVPASVVLGQKIQETGWNESTVGQNNYFNIKGNGTGGYRDYSSKEESFMDYGKLLSGSRYTQYTSKATTVEEYVTGIKQAGYAEDPNYVSNVMQVISDNDLTTYDNGSIISTGLFSSNKNNTTWWGDIVTVVFAIVLVIMGVVFIGLAVTNNNVIDTAKMIQKAVKK